MENIKQQQAFGFVDDMPVSPKILQERFVAPPFSVLDTKQGYWQERKRAWVSLGIQSEVGRDAVAIVNTVTDKYEYFSGRGSSDTSIFDPVLCEIMYRWFCPDGGHVLDPFAGGSVRGIVAYYLDYAYSGVELRAEQVGANREQSRIICGSLEDNENKLTPWPSWMIGDSRNIGSIVPGKYDMILTCPPYYDLEVYSDDPADISAAPTYKQFSQMYFEIIVASLALLKDNSFAVVIVGDIRDKQGFYMDVLRMMSSYLETFKSCAALPIRYTCYQTGNIRRVHVWNMK